MCKLTILVYTNSPKYSDFGQEILYIYLSHVQKVKTKSKKTEGW